MSIDTETHKKSNYDLSDVSVVMGAYNEEKAIGNVIEEIQEATDNKAEIIVVDGSNDRTGEIAEAMGAKVISQKPQGYGIALAEGLENASRPVIITTDCDGTYPMTDIPRFVDKINEGYDVVGGIRLRGMKTPNMKPFNALGNLIFVFLVSILYGKRVHDTTTGMRAYRKSMIDEVTWEENTGLSAELLFKPIMYGYKVIEVPIEYRPRYGETKLDPLTGGWQIFYSIIKYKKLRLFLIFLVTIGLLTSVIYTLYN